MSGMFHFDRLTIGDLVALSSAENFAQMIPVVAKCFDGDLYAVPLPQAYVLLSHFTREFREYTTVAAKAAENETVPDAIQLLRRLFGDAS